MISHRQPKIRSGLRIAAGAYALGLAATAPTFAQERPVPEGSPLPDYARRIELPPEFERPAIDDLILDNGLPNVVLTGYWPPTNEMVRRFSPDPVQNPEGWIGGDWEGRGYNVYAFFPEFPQGVGKGEGDFEVDYQDTSGDWWRIIPSLRPISIITFSRAGFDRNWTIEGGNRTYPENEWIGDFLPPLRPTPELPIMIEEPPYAERYSSQPMEAIRDAVREQVPSLNPVITPLDTSNYLSNFIGYHGNWYHDLHDDRADREWVITGGHVHVGFQMSLEEAVAATEVTVRVVLDHLDARRALTADLDGDGEVDLDDHARLVTCLAGPAEHNPPEGCTDRQFTLADLDEDGAVTLADFAVLVTQFAQRVD